MIKLDVGKFIGSVSQFTSKLVNVFTKSKRSAGLDAALLVALGIPVIFCIFLGESDVALSIFWVVTLIGWCKIKQLNAEIEGERIKNQIEFQKSTNVQPLVAYAMEEIHQNEQLRHRREISGE